MASPVTTCSACSTSRVLQYISVTLERLILYLSPTLVLLINVLQARQRPGRREIGALLPSCLGVLIAFGHDLQCEGGKIILGSLRRSSLSRSARRTKQVTEGFQGQS